MKLEDLERQYAGKVCGTEKPKDQPVVEPDDEDEEDDVDHELIESLEIAALFTRDDDSMQKLLKDAAKRIKELAGHDEDYWTAIDLLHRADKVLDQIILMPAKATIRWTPPNMTEIAEEVTEFLEDYEFADDDTE